MSENSTHRVEIVPVELRPHGNADSLSVVEVFGYTAVVRTADWSDKSLGAYLPPDSVVDTTRPEFAFLANGQKNLHRVRAKKLRGVQSFGLLIPAPRGYAIGDDVADALGVAHYEPEMSAAVAGGTSVEAETPPPILACLSKYDIDAMRRYHHVFAPGEPVIATEKIHGANARYCYADGRMWCGSRSEWKKEDASNLWWKALTATPGLQCYCEANPGHVVYGEVYGDVQSFRYGCSKGQVHFAAFDLWLPEGKWADAMECRRALAAIPQVPLLYSGPFDFTAMCELAEGPSQMPGADHIREGCVVKPLVERRDRHIGRVCLKVVGAGYLEQ